MTSALPHCSLVSPYFPDPSVGRANAAAAKIDAWSAYASRSLGTTPESGPSSAKPVDEGYLGHFHNLQERQKNRHDVTSSDYIRRNQSNATKINRNEIPTCFAPTPAIVPRDNANFDEGDNSVQMQQILTNLKIRCRTDVYKNPSSSPSPVLSSTPLSLSTQPHSLYAYNRPVHDATRSLYGTPRGPTQMQRQYATCGSPPFLAGSQTYRYLNDFSNDYSPDMLSPQMVSNLENLISSPVPQSARRVYKQPNELHMGLPSGQLVVTPDSAWFLSQDRPDNSLHISGSGDPDLVPYYGRPSSSTSDISSSSLSSPVSGPRKQTSDTVTYGNSSAVWGFDSQAYLVDPLDGRHYGIAEEILVQQRAYPTSHAPTNPDAKENFPANYNQIFHTTGPYTDTQVTCASNRFSRNRNLHSLAISTSGLNTQMSCSVTSSPLPSRRGSFDENFSTFNASKSAVVGGPFQAGGHSYTQNPHQRRHSVSSNPPLSAVSSSSSTLTNQSIASGGTTSAVGEKDMKKVSLYKTEMCRSFEETGSCRYGNKCQFAHGQDELRTVERHPKHKSVMCKTFWEQGSCPYGQRCCFIHTALPSERGTVSIQSRTQFQPAPPSGASHSLPAKPPAVALSAIPTGKHNRQSSGSHASLYPVEDDAVVNAINPTVDTSKLAKGPTTSTFPSGSVTTTSPTSDLVEPTLGSTIVGFSSMQRRLRRASLGDAEDVGLLVPTLKYICKQSQCACSTIGGVGSCCSCSANSKTIAARTRRHNHVRTKTITSGELSYHQQHQQHQDQQQPINGTRRRSSLTESGARRLPIFQSIQS